MAAGWVKVACDLDSNPKIRRAGRNGREVFLFLLRRTNLLERDGRCARSNIDAWYLADQLMMSEAEASEGVERAIAAGLIALDGDHVVICGWDDRWAKRPADSAERTERWRAKQRVRNASVSPDVTDRHGDGCDGSPASPIVTDRHGDGCDGSDQRREDQDQIRDQEAVARPASLGVTDRHGDGCDGSPTSPIVTDRYGDGCDGSDQIREDQDQRRSEIKKPSLTPAGRSQPPQRYDTDVGDHKRAVDAFHRYFVSTHDGARPTWGAMQIKQVKDLVRKHSVDEVVRRISILATAPPQWPSPPWDLATFVRQFDRLASPGNHNASFFDVIDALPLRSEHPDQEAPS